MAKIDIYQKGEMFGKMYFIVNEKVFNNVNDVVAHIKSVFEKEKDSEIILHSNITDSLKTKINELYGIKVKISNK